MKTENMHFTKLLNGLTKFLVVFLSVLFTLFFCWLASWGMYLGYIGVILMIGGLCGWVYFRLRYWIISMILIVMVSLLLIPQSVSIYNQKTELYMDKIGSGDHLSWLEMVSIYGLNVVMSVLAYPVYPEVAVESWYMMFQCDQQVRIFEDDFFLNSKKVKAAFANNDSHVVWSASCYHFGDPESRYALALNPCELKKEITANGVEYSASVKVEYPERTKATLLKYPIEIQVEEGLFNYLQSRGWLHTYTAVWKCNDSH